MALLARLIVSLSLLVASIAIAGETRIGFPAHGAQSAAAPSHADHGDCADHADETEASAEAEACCAATALHCTGLTARPEVWALASTRTVKPTRALLAPAVRAGSDPEGELRPPRA